MNWREIKRFNFTWAIPGGAWVEDASGYRNWYSFTMIEREKGKEWVEKALEKQGWMTGCWVELEARQ